MPVEGILPVIPTPFLDASFDARSFERLLEHMLPSVDGYTLLGSTGEAPSLTDQERRRIAESALAMTPPEKRVVVGVSHTSAAASADLARHAQEHGASAVLCSAPYYYPNSPDGILRHLATIDSALEVDLVVYDNPIATKTKIAADDVVRWASQLEHMTAVKLTDHELAKIELWQHAGLNVLAGDDPIILRYLAAGVDGAIVIAPAVFPEAFREVWALMRDGNALEALRIAGARILPFLHVFGIGDEIATTKALLKEIGLFTSDELLAPLVGVTAERRRLLRDAYDACRDGSAQLSARGGS